MRSLILGHVFEDVLKVIVLPPDIRIFNIGFGAVEFAERVGAGAAIGIFSVVGHGHAKFERHGIKADHTAVG